MPQSHSQPAAVILAAGKGTRMQSDLPKVCHEVGGRAMVCAVVDACRAAGCAKIVIVVGYMQELVRDALAGFDVEFVEQHEQLGTGHAVLCAKDALADFDADVFVLCGDGPLIRPSTLGAVLDRHRSTQASSTLATSVIENPDGYGRIVRDDAGAFVAIVEQNNATVEQLKVHEVNPSYYCFNCLSLFDALSRVERNESSGEYYVTDVPAILMQDGKRVEVIDAVPPQDVLSINSPADLREVDRIYRERTSVGGAA